MGVHCHWDEHDVFVNQFANDPIPVYPFFCNRVTLALPHQLSFLLPLQLRIGSGRNGFNYICRFGKIKVFIRGGNRNITTNTSVVTGIRSHRRRTWVDVERQIKGVGPKITVDQMGFLRFKFDWREDVSRRSKHSLESEGPSIPNEMMHHSFVIFRATKDMVAPSVMGLATPASRAVGRVIDGQSKFPQHTEHEVPILEAVSRDAVAHCNEG